MLISTAAASHTTHIETPESTMSIKVGCLVVLVLAIAHVCPTVDAISCQQAEKECEDAPACAPLLTAFKSSCLEKDDCSTCQPDKEALATHDHGKGYLDCQCGPDEGCLARKLLAHACPRG